MHEVALGTGITFAKPKPKRIKFDTRLPPRRASSCVGCAGRATPCTHIKGSKTYGRASPCTKSTNSRRLTSHVQGISMHEVALGPGITCAKPNHKRINFNTAGHSHAP